MKTKWHYTGDVNMLDYGGKNFRHIGKRQFQFVELIDMDDACSSDNEGQPKYVVELRLVDLDIIPQVEQDRAKQSCGWKGMQDTDLALAEVCDSYGCHAPLESWQGNNARKLMREAYCEANRLLEENCLNEQLDKVVNKIGSTAREFMAGDFFSGLQRGVESGQQDARIMAKMYGVDQQTIDDVRPQDWLPYFMGYSDAIGGREKESEGKEPGDKLAPEYHRGYERGVNVKAGKCPAPGWIKQG